MANVWNNTKSWFANYFPRFYIPAYKPKNATLEEVQSELRNAQLIANGLIDAVGYGRRNLETLKEEAIGLISGLVLQNGGEVVLRSDFIDTILSNQFSLTIKVEDDHSIRFKLEENLKPTVDETPPVEYTEGQGLPEPVPTPQKVTNEL